MANPLPGHLPRYVLIDGAEVGAAGPRYRAYAAVCRRAAALPTPPPIGVMTSAIGGPRRRLR